MFDIIAKYIFGSEDSTDIDVLYILKELPEDIFTCKNICNELENENENVNLATIENGIINKCFKGTIDELNNSVYNTYHLHEQSYELLINRTVERDLYLKMIRAVRTILSHLSRSCHREIIKSALRGSWNERLNALKTISTSKEYINFDELNKNMSGRDIMKVIAFQIGQTEALMSNFEIYDKSGVKNFYFHLSKYIDRQCDDYTDLFKALHFFSALCRNYKFVSNDTEVCFSNGNGMVWYDLKKEKKTAESKYINTIEDT